MLKKIDGSVSRLTRGQLASYLETEAPDLVGFMEEYFRWLEETRIWRITHDSDEVPTVGSTVVSPSDPVTSWVVVSAERGSFSVLTDSDSPPWMAGTELRSVTGVRSGLPSTVVADRGTPSLVGEVRVSWSPISGSWAVGEMVFQRETGFQGQLTFANSTTAVVRGISGVLRSDVSDPRIEGVSTLAQATVLSSVSTNFLDDVRAGQWVRVSDRVFEVGEVWSDYLLNLRGSFSYSYPSSTYEVYDLSGPTRVISVDRNPNAVGAGRRLPQNLDVDQMDPSFLRSLRSQYLGSLPSDTAMDLRRVIKHSLDLLRTKGTERGYELLFRVLYDEDVEVYRPSEHVLRPDEADWRIDEYVEVNLDPRLSDVVGLKIEAAGGSAEGVVESYSRQVVNGRQVGVLGLSSTVGEFHRGDVVTCGEIIGPTDGPLVTGSLTAVGITGGGFDWEVGDVLDVVGEGRRGKARVVSTRQENGKVTFKLLDGGYGYSMSPSIVVTSSLSAQTISATVDGRDLVFDGSVRMNRGWRAEGNGIPDVIGGVIVDQVSRDDLLWTDQRTGDGVQTVFQLTVSGDNVATQVTVGGSPRSYPSDYMVEGRTLTFSSAPGVSNSVVVSTPTTVTRTTLSTAVTVANGTSVTFRTGGSGATFRVGDLVDREIIRINDDDLQDYLSLPAEDMSDEYYVVVSGRSAPVANGSMIRGTMNVLTIDVSTTPSYGVLTIGENLNWVGNGSLAGVVSNNMGSFVQLTGWEANAQFTGSQLVGQNSLVQVTVNSRINGQSTSNVEGMGVIDDSGVPAPNYEPWGVTLGTNGAVMLVSNTYTLASPAGNVAGYFYRGMSAYTNNALLTISANTGALPTGSRVYQNSSPTVNTAVGYVVGANTTQIRVTGVTGVFATGTLRLEGSAVTATVSGTAANTQTMTVDRVIRLTDWGFPMVTQPADLDNMDTLVGEALSYEDLEVGTISYLSAINPGSGYSANPIVTVVEPSVRDLAIPDGRGGIKGADAEVSATAGVATGVALGVEVFDSGLGYQDGERLVLTSPTNQTAVSGFAWVERHGRGEGSWGDTRSFVDSDQHLQDDEFYQQFSYEIRAPRSKESYEDVLRESHHVAGMALFGSVRHVDDEDASSRVSEEDVETGLGRSPATLGSSSRIGVSSNGQVYRYPAWVLAPEGVTPIVDIDFVNDRSWSVDTGEANSSALVQLQMSSGTYSNWVECANGTWTPVPDGVLPRSDLGLWGWTTANHVVGFNRDLTNPYWIKNGITVTRAPGIDGVANSGSRIQATTANATVMMTPYNGAANAFRLTSAFVKRGAGTGNVKMTDDGGITWNTITVPKNSGGFSRVTIPPSNTTANSWTVGFMLDVSGDSIHVDMICNESKNANSAGPNFDGATAPIATSNSANPPILRGSQRYYVPIPRPTKTFSLMTEYQPFSPPTTNTEMIGSVGNDEGGLLNRIYHYRRYDIGTRFGGFVNNTSLGDMTLLSGPPADRYQIIRVGSTFTPTYRRSKYNDRSILTSSVVSDPPVWADMWVASFKTINYFTGAVRRITLWDAELSNTQLTAAVYTPGDPSNLLPGADFENPSIRPWNITGSRFQNDSTRFRSGAGSLMQGPSGSNPPGTAPISVKPGEVYYVEAWATRDASYNGGVNSKIRFGDATTGVFLGGVSWETQYVPTSSWVKCSASFTIPSGTNAMSVAIWGDSTAGYCWVDDIVVRRVG